MSTEAMSGTGHEGPIYGDRAMSASPPKATKSLRRTK
jgi:hypothetical protein